MTSLSVLFFIGRRALLEGPHGVLGRGRSSPGCSQTPQLTSVAWQTAPLLKGKAGATSIRSYKSHLHGHTGVAEAVQRASVCPGVPTRHLLLQVLCPCSSTAQLCSREVPRNFPLCTALNTAPET